MSALIVLDQQLEVPANLDSLADFRRWALSDGFPERGRIDFIGERIEVDMSPENLFTHGTPKVELIVVVGRRVKEDRLGEVFSDRTRVTHVEALLSVEPDLVFLSNDSMREGRVHLVPAVSGEEGQFIEIEGGPDLVAEIVSTSSEHKDKKRLPPRYFQAGVREYWLVDARGREVEFHIHRRGKKGFIRAAADKQGFQASEVLGYRYRMERSRNEFGRSQYDLLEEPLS